MPILFPPDAAAFATHGLGTLSDCAACTVTEERNGAFELEMSYPISGVHFGHIQQRSIILAEPNKGAAPQPFRVYRISRPIGGLVTVYAYHISYDLSGYPVAPYTASNAQTAVAGLKRYAIAAPPFSITTNLTGTGAFEVRVPMPIRSTFGGSEGSLIDVYGGEWEYDGFTARLLSARGADRGVKILYGKNLTDLNQEENCANSYTGIVPYYSSGDAPAVVGGVISAVTNADHTKILPVDLTQSFEAPPTVAQLNVAGRDYLKTHSIAMPTVSLSVSFVFLRGSSAYADAAPLEDVRLCDTVTISFPRLGVDAKAKVVKTVYDCLTERLTSVDVGTVRTSIADTLAASAQELKTKPSTGAMERAILSATAQITGASGGYVITRYNAQGKPYELLIMDTDSINTAKDVWRWNSGGFGHSSSGYNGPYATAITQDGQIVANFITTGELSADRIKGGTIDAANINVTNINGENIRDKTLGNAPFKDSAVTNRVIGGGAVSYGKTSFTGTLDQVGVNKSNIETINGFFTGSANFQQLSAKSIYLNGKKISAEPFYIDGKGYQICTWDNS